MRFGGRRLLEGWNRLRIEQIARRQKGDIDALRRRERRIVRLGRRASLRNNDDRRTRSRKPNIRQDILD